MCAATPMDLSPVSMPSSLTQEDDIAKTLREKPNRPSMISLDRRSVFTNPLANQNLEFFTWGNLPPPELMHKCMTRFMDGESHVNRELCPIKPAEIQKMFEKVYRQSTTSAHGGLRIRQEANSWLCQLLLFAAIGALYLDDVDATLLARSLLSSGKRHLDTVLGMPMSHQVRASLLAGLGFLYDKDIRCFHYLSLSRQRSCGGNSAAVLTLGNRPGRKDRTRDWVARDAATIAIGVSDGRRATRVGVLAPSMDGCRLSDGVRIIRYIHCREGRFSWRRMHDRLKMKSAYYHWPRW